MPTEIIQRPQVEEKGKYFETGEGLSDIKNFDSRARELEDVKGRIGSNVDKMNKRLKDTLGKEEGLMSIFEDVLTKDELKNAVEVIDGELSQLEKKFDDKLIKISETAGGPTNTQAGIVKALESFNSDFETFLSSRIETIISEADWADGDKQELLAALYPNKEDNDDDKPRENLFKAGGEAAKAHKTGKGGKHAKIARIFREANQ